MQTALYKMVTISPEKVNISGKNAEESILKALAYFDIFQYPLLQSEIIEFSDQPLNESFLEKTLEQLLHEKRVFRLDNFYSLQNNLLLKEKRIQGNRRAEQLLPKAMKIGRFLSKFPFVRAIGISGSLSKHYADENADIDFFVITKTNRVWIARTLMHIFKKFTFITGRQHFYCMNYYVDEMALQIEEKNIFTAIEVKTLVPVCGKEILDNFFTANKWSDEFLPACNCRRLQNIEPPAGWFKKFIEWILNNKVGDRIDNYLLKISSRRWKRKEQSGKQNKKGQTMGLITGRHFARSNPESFQEKLLSLYDEKLSVMKLKNARIIRIDQAFL
jgi:hypothetical protein